MDKMREEFEGWAKSEELDTVKYVATDVYCYPETHAAWLVWQSSRQALVIELPATCFRTLVFEIEGSSEVGMEHDEYYEVDDILSALNDAGIKYK